MQRHPYTGPYYRLLDPICGQPVLHTASLEDIEEHRLVRVQIEHEYKALWIDNYHRATNAAARRYYLRRALERGVAAKAWPTAPVVRVQ